MNHTDVSQQQKTPSNNGRKNNFDDGWEVMTVRSIDEIEAIRPLWEKMQADEPYPIVNADIDRYLSVLRAAGDECSPLVLIFRHNGRLRAMVVGRLEGQGIPLRIGYKIILKPELRCFTVIYGGILAPPEDAVSTVLVRSLMDLLRRREVDAILLNHLRVDSSFYRQVATMPHFLCRNHFPVVHPHWRMLIPGTIEEFYQGLSPKHRGNIRRAVKKLEEQWQDQLEIIHYRRVEEIQRLCEDVECVSVKTYQHSLGAGFQNTPLMQSMSDADARRGRLFVSVLYLQNQARAFQWGTVFGCTYFLERMGYDPAWRKSGLGTVLFVKVLELLCADNGLEQIDFGFGDAMYKESYGNESWQEVATAYILAPRFYPLFIGLLDSANAGLTRLLTAIARKAELLAWIKRLWRRRLQRTGTQGSKATLDPDKSAS